MALGRSTRCHQLPERSFFAKSYQFPVCSRCTGVFFGNISAVILAFIYTPHWQWLLWGCSIMFTDWLLQRLDLLESNNIRRLITGVIGGYSLASLGIVATLFLINKIGAFI